jgi:hypothetical protein
VRNGGSVLYNGRNKRLARRRYRATNMHNLLSMFEVMCEPSSQSFSFTSYPANSMQLATTPGLFWDACEQYESELELHLMDFYVLAPILATSVLKYSTRWQTQLATSLYAFGLQQQD